MDLREVEAVELARRNRLVKVVITKPIPEPAAKEWDLSGKGEADVPYWLAEELVNSGHATFRDEESLSATSLSKIHWRETIPSSRQLPALEDSFYHKARNLLRQLKSDPARVRDYEKAEGLYRDILNCRLRKIVALAASTAQADALYPNLSREEKILFRSLQSIVGEWRKAMLAME